MFLYFLGVEVVLLSFEELICEVAQVRRLTQVHAKLMHVLTGLSQQLVHNGDGWGLETQTKLDRVRWDEPSRRRRDPIGLIPLALDSSCNGAGAPNITHFESMKLFRH